jgi:RpiR family transcriptional regulator, carbohydrate utilization regulator
MSEEDGGGAPARYPIKGCLLKIRSLYPSLPKVHRRIADRILETPQAIIKLPVTELAASADASEASVVLFCKKLGFRGYHDLKIALAEEVFSSDSDIHEEIGSQDDAPAIIQKVFNTSIQTLRDTLKVLDGKAIEEAAVLMGGAKRVAIVGIGTSGVFANDFWMKLFRIGMNVNFYDNQTAMRMAASIMDPDCVMFAISHSGSTIAVVSALQNARERGVKTIGLTNYLNSPMTQYLDVLLLTSSRESGVREEEMTSRIAQLAVIDTLFVTIANKTHERSSALLKLTRGAVSDDKV